MFRRKGLLLLGLAFGFSVPAFAVFGNYNSILIGEKASGMGGAAAAVVGDASSCAWYNPATCAFLEGRSFSAAVGIYKKFATTYGQNEDLVKAGTQVNQGFFQALPSSTGSITHFPDFFPDDTFSLSIIVPEFDTFNGDISNGSTGKTTLNYTDQSLWVGSSISRKISANQSVGFTFYYTSRSFTSSLADRVFLSNAQWNVYEEQVALTQNTVVAQMGYYHHYTENWDFGIGIRFPSLQVAGSATYFANTLSSGNAPSSSNYSGLSSHVHIPAKLTLGTSWSKKGLITIAADASAYSHEAYNDIECAAPGVSQNIENRAIVNGSLGLEYYLKDWLKLRAGAFTNMSSYPRPDVTKVRGEGDHVDMLGWSANLALKSGPITYTFGGYYIGGRGVSAEYVNQQVSIVVKNQQVFTMLVASSFSY